MREEQIAQTFKALSVVTRLRILKLIKSRPMCVGAIADRLPVSQSAVSQHLNILHKAGLVQRSQHGSIVHYELDAKKLAAFKRSVRRTLGSAFVDLPS